jgi:protein-S-isoprenylcysteine O-methyltransferase Ste14
VWSHLTRLLLLAAYAAGLALGPGRESFSGLVGLPAVWVRAIGISGLLLGASLLLWAEATLGRSLSPLFGVREGQRLIVHGPYALVRHPLYTAMLLALPGTALAVDRLLEVVFLGVLLPATIFWNVRLEEPVLLEGFGRTYAEYAARVPALLPRPLGRPRPLPGGPRTPGGSPT